VFSFSYLGELMLRTILPALLALLVPFFCRAAEGVDESPLNVHVEPAFPKLSFVRPLVLTHAGDGTNRVFVVSQLGSIHVFPNNQAADTSKVFLDISSRVVYKEKENEEGLLGLAFHPRYKENGQFFVYYSTTASPHTTVVSRFRVSASDPDRADAASEQELLRVKHPYWNHKGGTICFGPDGFLYIAIGDGGAANDPHRNGQNLQTMLGKILRIDVDRRDAGKQYAVPKDNPFVSSGQALPEIYAYGLRNVWRMSFDRQTGALWAADVGQDIWEEINLIVPGGNYGWNLREGFHVFVPKNGRAHPDAARKQGMIDPIWEYHHDIGKSITGGHVYRGARVPELVGHYLYADYVTGRLWALRYDEAKRKVVANRTIAGNIKPVFSYGEDEAGEVYFMVDAGSLHRFASGKP
jgi:quinoprotein glucose dehydrogenase